MNQGRKFHDDDRISAMPLIWAGVTFFVAGMLTFVTKWERLVLLHAAGDSLENLVWAVAGYTLPLTAGFAIVGFLVIRYFEYPEDRRFNLLVLVTICGVILWVCGLLARASHLGLPPAQETLRSYGHPVTFGLSVLKAYYDSYGWPLMVCALAIGGTAAYHTDLHFRKLRGDLG